MDVGYALWTDREVAWAAGTVEYRALGAAVISITDLFRADDFRKDLKPPAFSDTTFAGYFASLGHVNRHLSAARGKIKAK
jgi:hypothetical protein